MDSDNEEKVHTAIEIKEPEKVQNFDATSNIVSRTLLM